MNKYIWLVKHLIWNGSQPTGKVYWVKTPVADAEELKKKYKVHSQRTLSDSTVVDVIEMLDNYIVLDTRV
jgi:hypothetical protein